MSVPADLAPQAALPTHPPPQMSPVFWGRCSFLHTPTSQVDPSLGRDSSAVELAAPHTCAGLSPAATRNGYPTPAPGVLRVSRGHWRAPTQRARIPVTREQPRSPSLRGLVQCPSRAAPGAPSPAASALAAVNALLVTLMLFHVMVQEISAGCAKGVFLPHSPIQKISFG